MSRHCTHDPEAVVARQSLFASLSPAECRALVSRSVCRSFSRGELLFREGDPCRGLYLVVEGAVRIYRANQRGDEQVLGLCEPGDSFGDASLFDEGPYLASARATESGRVLFLPFGEVQALYRTHPEVALAAVRELGERVRSLVALVDQLSLRDVPARVASCVVRFAEECGALGNTTSFRLPRTQEELAAELGTTREGVSRALRDLRMSGVIRQRGSRIQVLDPARLRRLSGDRPMAARPAGVYHPGGLAVAASAG